MKWWFKGLLLACLAGCNSGSATNSVEPRNQLQRTKTRQEILYEKIHSGAFQLDVAADAIQAAFEASLKLRDSAPKGTDLKEALSAISDDLNSAGSESTDTPEPPGSTSDVLQDESEFERRFQAFVKAAKDAKRDLDEARSILETILKVATGEERAPIQDLADLVDRALEGVSGALEAFAPGSAASS